MAKSSRFIAADHPVFASAAYQRDIHLLDVLDAIIRPNAFLRLSDGQHYVIARNRLDLAAWLWTSEDIPAQALDELCELLRVHFAGRVIHITAKEGVADAIVQRYQAIGYRYEKGIGLIAYKLSQLNMPEDKGPIRPARMDELPLLGRMYADFQVACFGHVQDEACEEAMRSLIEAEHLWLLEKDGQVVSMVSAVTPPGSVHSRVRMVYTIPEAEGNGYAKWLTAKVCDRALQRCPYAILYADADNPRSNAAYQRIGFEPMGVMREMRFTKEDGADNTAQ